MLLRTDHDIKFIAKHPVYNLSTYLSIFSARTTAFLQRSTGQGINQYIRLPDHFSPLVFSIALDSVRRVV
jgi:hypothetical protein